MKEKETGGKRKGSLCSVFGPLVPCFWFPLLPCCAHRLGSHHSRRAVWQLPGLTLAHGSPTVATGRVLLFSQARAQICCLAAFPAQGLPLGQVGPGDSAEKTAAISLWVVTSLTNKETPGPWVLGQGTASNPASLGEEDGQSRAG